MLLSKKLQRKNTCERDWSLYVSFVELNQLFINRNLRTIDVIDNNTLVAITLLIAESSPKEKEKNVVF